jgi:transcriptional regulator with XRE-family HTH domain
VSNELGTLLHYHRNRLGLSQQEAADTIGCTQQSWSRYEAGFIMPPLHRIVKIAREFNADLGQLREASEHDAERRADKDAERPTTRVQQLEQRVAELEALLVGEAQAKRTAGSKTAAKQAPARPAQRRRRASQ